VINRCFLDLNLNLVVSVGCFCLVMCCILISIGIAHARRIQHLKDGQCKESIAVRKPSHVIH